MPFPCLHSGLRPGRSPGWAGVPWGRVQLLSLALTLLVLLTAPVRAVAAPGLCVGPVCGDEFQRSPGRPFQLRLRLSDQRGHHERVIVDCRDGRISPEIGAVERGYGAAVARRACRLSQMEEPRA